MCLDPSRDYRAQPKLSSGTLKGLSVRESDDGIRRRFRPEIRLISAFPNVTFKNSTTFLLQNGHEFVQITSIQQF
jgi:hypothetical protein